MKTILITGGSDGLGKATAKLLAKNNKVIILGKDEAKTQKAAKELKVDFVVCDVSNYNQVEAAIANVLKTHKKIDVLINNAGVWLAGDLTENSYEEINRCLSVNTTGHIYITKAVIPSMLKNKGGKIIQVLSTASFECDDYDPVYTASKWALRGFNRSIQKVYSKNNIKVTAFYPGFMQTDLFKKAGNNYDTSTGLNIKEVAKAIEYIIGVEGDVNIPQFEIRDIENY